MKSEIRLEMKEIRRMLEEIKSNTAYFREFMEKYNIPMQEEVAKEQKEVMAVFRFMSGYGQMNSMQARNRRTQRC